MKRLLSAIIILAFIVSLVPAYAAGVNGSLLSRDELIANYEAVERYIRNSAKSEFGHCSSGNSSTLAWAASYMLESYAQMYKNTGDRRYLKTLGECFREALAHLNYDYGEDKPGWDAPNYSVKRINAKNSAFDTALTQPSGADSVSTNAWMRSFSSDSNAIEIKSNSGVSGNALHIKSGNSKLQGAEISIPEYAEGTIFQLSAYVKNNVPARAYVTDESGNLLETLDGEAHVIFNSSNSFANKTVRFRIPENGGTLTLHLESSDIDAEGDIYFDNVTFQQAAQFHVHDMMMVSAGAKFIEAVYLDEKLARSTFETGKTYKDIADEFLEAVETLIEKWDFCWKEDGDIGVYVWPDDDSSAYRGNTLPHNQYIKMACAMMPLYNVTHSPLYLERATKMLNFFKKNLKTGEEAGEEYYYWNYYDPAFPTDYLSETPEDISHGCLELDAAIMAYERGLIFNEEDMKKFANSFVVMLWNGDLENPVLYNNLTNNPSHASYQKVMTADSNVRDWARLGKWNRNIAIAVSNYMAQHNPTSGHPTKMLAYAYAYPYIFNPLKWIMVETTTEQGRNQVEGHETPATFKLIPNEGADDSGFDKTVWSVTKAGEEFASGTGATFTFTPSGRGTYKITATVSGFSDNYNMHVNAISGSGGGPDDEGGDTPTDPDTGDDPNGGEDEGGAGTGSGTGSRPSYGGGGGGGGGGGAAPITPTDKEEEKKEEAEKQEDSSDNSQPEPEKPKHHKNFSDTANGGWFSDAVDHVVENGYMTGTGNGKFEPEGNMTRAMLAKVLHNMEKNPKASAGNAFRDVKSGEWYSEAIIWASELGIVSGYGNGNFGTNDHITREQLAVMLWRYSGCRKAETELSFNDAEKISDWALDAMRWAVENGILNGKNGNILAPHEKASRAEVAQMLLNFSENIK